MRCGEIECDKLKTPVMDDSPRVRKLSDLRGGWRPSPSPRRRVQPLPPSSKPRTSKEESKSQTKRSTKETSAQGVPGVTTGLQAVRFFLENPDSGIEFFLANHVEGGVSAKKSRRYQNLQTAPDSTDPLALRIVPSRSQLDANYVVIFRDSLTFFK